MRNNYAYSRGLSKRTRMVFSFFEYLLSFQRYSSFCSKIDDITNCISTKINHKIKNISENIGVMLLKLGTSNVSQVRQKMTPSVLLNSFAFRPILCLIDIPIFCLNQTMFTPNELARRCREYGYFVCFNYRTVCLPLSGQKWRYLVYSREGLGPSVIPWQRQTGCQFVSYLAYILVPSLSSITPIFPKIFKIL